MGPGDGSCGSPPSLCCSLCQCGHDGRLFVRSLPAGASVCPALLVTATLLTPPSEAAAGENSTSYFPLLDRIAGGYFASIASDSGLYDKFLHVLQQDGHITSPEALSTFNLALSLRSAAPRVEAHYQYYSTAVESVVEDEAASDCRDWVQIDGSKHCDPSLATATKEALLSSYVRELQPQNYTYMITAKSSLCHLTGLRDLAKMLSSTPTPYPPHSPDFTKHYAKQP